MFHLFISYSKKDTSELAKKLFNALKDDGFSAWMDEDLISGESWSKQIEAELTKADIVIVLLSPDVNRTKSSKQDRSFVLNEIDYAQTLHKPILPIMAESIVPPVQLAGIQYIDFTKDAEAGYAKLLKTLGVSKPPPQVVLFSPFVIWSIVFVILLISGILSVMFWLSNQAKLELTEIPCCIASEIVSNTPTDTPTVSLVPSNTPSETATNTQTPSPTATETATDTQTPSPTATEMASYTPSPSPVPVDLTIGFLLDISRNMREDLNDGRRPYTEALESIEAILGSIDEGRSNRVILQLVGQERFDPPIAGTCDANNTSHYFDAVNPEIGILQGDLRLLLPRNDNEPAYETGLQAILGEIARPASDNQGYTLLFIFAGSDSLQPCSDGSLDETMQFVFDAFDGEMISINYCTFLMGGRYRLQGAEHNALVEQYGCVANVDEAVNLGQAIVDNAEAIIDATQTPNSAPAPTSITISRSVGLTPRPPTARPSITLTPSETLRPSETLNPSITPMPSETLTPTITSLVSPSYTPSATITPTTEAPTSIPAATEVPAPVVPPAPSQCTLTVTFATGVNVRPYPEDVSVNIGGGLPLGATEIGRRRMVGAPSGTWYLVSNGWVIESGVATSGPCDNIPADTFVQPPTDTSVPTDVSTQEIAPTGGSGSGGGGGGTPHIEIISVSVQAANSSGCPATIKVRVSGGTVTGTFWVRNSSVTDEYNEGGSVTYGVGEHTYGVNFGGIGMSHEVRFTGNASAGWRGGGTCN
jgi:hypothetical protein